MTARGESGQAMIEFGIIGLLLMMMTAGLIDAGRAFYQYNAVSAAARFGARWGSVVGGTCALPYGQNSTTADWCNEQKVNSGAFWTVAGNTPIQGINTDCPSYASAPTDYYSVQSFLDTVNTNGEQPTTIVGAIARHFDSDNSHTSFLVGAVTPGFDLSKLEVCIALSGTDTAGSWSNIPPPGTQVSVTVYYPFDAASGLLPKGTIKLSATSAYQVE